MRCAAPRRRARSRDVIMRVRGSRWTSSVCSRVSGAAHSSALAPGSGIFARLLVRWGQWVERVILFSQLAEICLWRQRFKIRPVYFTKAAIITVFSCFLVLLSVGCCHLLSVVLKQTEHRSSPPARPQETFSCFALVLRAEGITDTCAKSHFACRSSVHQRPRALHLSDDAQSPRMTSLLHPNRA